MKQKLQLLLLLLMIIEVAFSQTITPAISNEFCPNVNITFTVTLPRITDNTFITVTSFTGGPTVVSSNANNPTNTSTQTTFTFVGRFRDVNVSQAFRVSYTTNTVPSATFDPAFKNIKSLFYARPTASSCPPIQPNQSSVTAARCQIVNIPVSFSNVKWSTFGEPSAYCFGSITTYEYQLPAGWSISSNVSTGSNWIQGTNSVTITSDLATGDGGVILIRPANNCAAGLANGEPPVQILVSRPAPTLSVTGQDFLCNANDQTTLTLNGLPSGATVVWDVSLPGQIQIVGCSTCTSVTVEKIGSASTTATVSATVTHCSFTYPPVSKTMKLGGPVGIGIVGYNNLDPCPGVESSFKVFPPTSTSVYQYEGSLTVGATGFANSISWGLTPGNTVNGWTYTYSGGTVTVGTKQHNTGLSLRATATNNCGSVYKDYRFWSGECLEVARVAAPQTSYILHPNPTKGVFAITLNNQDKTATIKEVMVKNKTGIVVKQLKYNNNQKTQTINIQNLPPDVYFVTIFDGKTWTGERIYKE